MISNTHIARGRIEFKVYHAIKILIGTYKNQEIAFTLTEIEEYVHDLCLDIGMKPSDLTVDDFDYALRKIVIAKYIRCIDYLD